MSIVLVGSSSGSITLQEPAVAGTTVLDLPATSGTVLTTGSTFAGTGPAFSAYLSGSNQTVTTGTTTKVALNAEEFDTANAFDSTTNYRFTPQVAGYYQVNGAIGFSASLLQLVIIFIYKNGTAFKRGNDLRASLGTDCVPVVSSLIYMNGTTDYLELWGYVEGTGTCRFNAVQTSTYFQASLVRAA